MHKTTSFNHLFFILGIAVLLFSGQSNAQVVIGAPNLGFSRACASDEFNTYNVTFIFSPETALSASNQFMVEMSDAVGSFSNSTIVFTSHPGAITTSPATIKFALPSTAAGEGYKLRIKSTAPAANSSSSVTFAAYYKIHDRPFTINNLVASAVFCSGGAYVLGIDNPSTGSNSSPLNYPSLTYKWYRETSPTTSVYVGEGPSLSVNKEGTYFVKTDYGSCSSNSFSNRVKITEVTSGEATASIVSSLGNPFCPSEGKTTLNTINGLSYQWFKDGKVIADATGQMYQTDLPGTYTVQINLGDCSASGSIDLEINGFESSLDVDRENSMDAGDALWATVTTTASHPQIQWYFNDAIITGETGASYEATAFGVYKVKIVQTSGCIMSEELSFSIQETKEPFPDVANIPNLISPNGDGVNDTWIIPSTYVSGTDTEIIIMNSQGKVVLQTKDYQNNWPENQLQLNSINQVFYYIITTQDQQTKKGSITLVK